MGEDRLLTRVLQRSPHNYTQNGMQSQLSKITSASPAIRKLPLHVSLFEEYGASGCLPDACLSLWEVLWRKASCQCTRAQSVGGVGPRAAPARNALGSSIQHPQKKRAEAFTNSPTARAPSWCSQVRPLLYSLILLLFVVLWASSRILAKIPASCSNP